jgi:hypothetical protein
MQPQALVLSLVMMLALAASSQATDSDTFQKTLEKRTDTDGSFKRGLCVCAGGGMNGQVGRLVWQTIPGTGQHRFTTFCHVATFDNFTGEHVADAACDSTNWVPLPK